MGFAAACRARTPHPLTAGASAGAAARDGRCAHLNRVSGAVFALVVGVDLLDASLCVDAADLLHFLKDALLGDGVALRGGRRRRLWAATEIVLARGAAAFTVLSKMRFRTFWSVFSGQREPVEVR